ncbi:MAG: YwiC-like family protein [Longimicrobiales bacterium]
MSGKPALLPREHGAYAELAFPLATGLALAGRPSLPALALGGAAVAFFLANEPLAILLGARGNRLQDQLGERARRRGAVLLGSGIGLGLAGILGAGSSVWPVILGPIVAGSLLFPLVLAGRQKSVVGELLVVTAFTTLILPLAAASGADAGRSAAALGVWWVSFALGTLEIHALKARHKNTGRSAWTRWASPVASGVAVLCALTAAFGSFEIPLEGPARAGTALPFLSGPGEGLDWVSAAGPYLRRSALALLPPALAILVLSLARIHPKHLKRVGWTLVGANALALLVLLWP